MLCIVLVKFVQERRIQTKVCVLSKISAPTEDGTSSNIKLKFYIFEVLSFDFDFQSDKSYVLHSQTYLYCIFLYLLFAFLLCGSLFTVYWFCALIFSRTALQPSNPSKQAYWQSLFLAPCLCPSYLMQYHICWREKTLRTTCYRTGIECRDDCWTHVRRKCNVKP